MNEYYKSQAGNGIASFAGVKYQKGFGFFGRLLSGAVLPFLRFIGKNALSAGANIAKDLVETDDFTMKNLRQSAEKRIKEGASSMLKRGAEKLLTGQGIKRKKHKKRKIRRKFIKVKKNKKINKKLRKKRKTKKRKRSSQDSFL